MDQGRKIRNAFGKLTRLRPDRRVMVFLFFLLVSTIFWFLSILGREYTSTLRYPVRYRNFPDKMVLVGDLPSNLELTVNAHGYTLLKHYFSRRVLPLVFNVSSFSLNRIPDTETKNYYILTSVAASRIAGQLGADIEILDIRPDTLFFNFTEMVSRNLPVKPVLNIDFEPQFMIKGNVGVYPDTIVASGPATQIDTMQFVPTVPLNIKGLNESVEKPVSLSGYEMISFSESSVRLTIPVEQFTEASIKVPVEAVNLPDTLKIKIFPSGITVSYLVALTDYEQINSRQFRATVDYTSILPGSGRLAVNLVKQPDLIKTVRFKPRNVDFIIETVDRASQADENQTNP